MACGVEFPVTGIGAFNLNLEYIFNVRILGFFIGWIAQSEEHQTFNLRVQGSSPCSGGFSVVVVAMT